MEESVFIREMLKNMAGVDFHSVPNTTEAVWVYLQQSSQDMLRIAFPPNDLPADWNRLEPDCIYEYTVLKIVRYLVCLDTLQNRLLIMGPVLTEPFSEEDIWQQFSQQRISNQIGKYLISFCQDLPVVSSQNLYKLADLIFRQLTGREQHFRLVHSQLEAELPQNFKLALSDHHEEIMRMRQVEHRYEMSGVLTEAVKQGNLSLALSLLRNWNPRKDQVARNDSPLRNNQNYCIVMNTQLRLALESTGIHPYRLDYLSNEMGLKIERVKSEKDLALLAKEIVTQYCRLVLEHTYPNLGRISRLAVTYMKDHLSENLTVKELADVLSVNADYLSHQFRKEMGITCIGFLNRERIRQAAAMLRNTELQIQQIALLVGYNNISYFARQFRIYYHTTPLAYRNSTAPTH